MDALKLFEYKLNGIDVHSKEFIEKFDADKRKEKKAQFLKKKGKYVLGAGKIVTLID